MYVVVEAAYLRIEWRKEAVSHEETAIVCVLENTCVNCEGKTYGRKELTRI